MKKQIITGIVIAACVALCAAVWPRSVEVEELSYEPHMGDVRMVNGEKQIYIPGFGWIKN